MGVVGVLGSDDLLSCFVVGNSFTWDDWFRLETEDDSFQAVIDGLLNVGIFVYIGTILPWSDFQNMTIGLSVGKLVGLAVLILILRRLPWILLFWKVLTEIEELKVRTLTSTVRKDVDFFLQEALLVGHFGPIGGEHLRV